MLKDLRILTFADLHGRYYREASALIDELEPTWIVLCGDMLPDFAMISGKESRLEAQRQYWTVYRSTFIRNTAVTTLVRGNHEIDGFSDPGLRRLPPALEGRVVRLEGIPAEHGAWGWSREWDIETLAHELQTQLRDVPYPRVYISHVPPYACLDTNGSDAHIGHRPLASHLDQRGLAGALVLCGHAHESFGLGYIGGTLQERTLVVNVACGYALVRFQNQRWRVLEMNTMGDRSAHWNRPDHEQDTE